MEVSFTPIAKDSEKILTPENIELIHTVIRPPEVPTEGTNSNISNFFGQNFLTKEASKESRLVSCKQTTEHPLISIALRITNCFFSELIPRTFQQRTFQSLFCDILLVQRQISLPLISLKEFLRTQIIRWDPTECSANKL